MDGRINKSLLSTGIFNQLPENLLKEFAASVRTEVYRKDQLLFNKGDEGDSMYIILDGEVKIHDGDHEIARLRKGDFFGELTLIDSSPRSLSVTASEPLETITITRKQFFDFFRDQPEVIQKIVGVISKRLRKQNENVVEQLRNREKELQMLVDQRTADLVEKNHELEETLQRLQTAQQQLIHSEKMASLGQLTAGIAHEIQNPLNFVNNFSFLSKDLLSELKEATTEEDRTEVMELLTDNLSKIEHHGKRAESIVKGMLMHSRMGSGERQLTNINSMCEETIGLAFQSMRSKYASFNSNIEKNFSKDLPPVNIIPQEVSRVVLNLLNNAFYAVNEKNQQMTSSDQVTEYRPLVRISTYLNNNTLKISVRDNGKGIPAKIREKVFQPFFTTKPTGEGTGLGLSLSYDIIKAHNGDITVDSKEGEFTEFVISLPV